MLRQSPLPQGGGPVSSAMRVLGGLARWGATECHHFSDGEVKK
jgi:hypothetical protein